MSLTVVVMARSHTVTNRFSISSGATPAYLQMTLTTGILMFGKMSVDIRVIVTTPTSTIRIAMTVKLYGRLRANRTIHILWIRMELGAWPQSVGPARRADPRKRSGQRGGSNHADSTLVFRAVGTR